MLSPPSDPRKDPFRWLLSMGELWIALAVLIAGALMFAYVVAAGSMMTMNVVTVLVLVAVLTSLAAVVIVNELAL